MADNTERPAATGAESDEATAADTAAGTDAAAPAAAPAADRATDRATRHVRAFTAAHGGTAEGHLSYLGERGYRLILVGADGGWGDQVAPRRETLVDAAERAGVPLRDSLDGELAGRMRTGPYEWSGMANRWTGT